ncbi:unnamed protein product [Tenebrio molitor]|nr:unnamed protein product [Tenebrio molitor]
MISARYRLFDYHFTITNFISCDFIIITYDSFLPCIVIFVQNCPILYARLVSYFLFTVVLFSRSPKNLRIKFFRTFFDRCNLVLI